MPSIQVRYYSRLRDIVGKNIEPFHLDPGSTIQDLLTAVVCRYPDLIPYRSGLLIARNAEYAETHCEVAEGDTIDLMPPVSGG
jgi:sulfur-carrier protein